MASVNSGVTYTSPSRAPSVVNRAPMTATAASPSAMRRFAREAGSAMYSGA